MPAGSAAATNEPLQGSLLVASRLSLAGPRPPPPPLAARAPPTPGARHHRVAAVRPAGVRERGRDGGGGAARGERRGLRVDRRQRRPGAAALGAGPGRGRSAPRRVSAPCMLNACAQAVRKGALRGFTTPARVPPSGTSSPQRLLHACPAHQGGPHRHPSTAQPSPPCPNPAPAPPSPTPPRPQPPLTPTNPAPTAPAQPRSALAS